MYPPLEFQVTAYESQKQNTREIQHILLLLYYIDKCPSEEKKKGKKNTTRNQE